jgi:hypothetical protein
MKILNKKIITLFAKLSILSILPKLKKREKNRTKYYHTPVIQQVTGAGCRCRWEAAQRTA